MVLEEGGGGADMVWSAVEVRVSRHQSSPTLSITPDIHTQNVTNVFLANQHQLGGYLQPLCLFRRLPKIRNCLFVGEMAPLQIAI